MAVNMLYGLPILDEDSPRKDPRCIRSERSKGLAVVLQLSIVRGPVEERPSDARTHATYTDSFSHHVDLYQAYPP